MSNAQTFPNSESYPQGYIATKLILKTLIAMLPAIIINKIHVSVVYMSVHLFHTFVSMTYLPNALFDYK